MAVTGTWEVSRPVAFPGTEEEKAANRLSHSFDYGDPDGDCRCYGCDARPSHVASDYPCGAHVPREFARFTYHDDGPTTVEVEAEEVALA